MLQFRMIWSLGGGMGLAALILILIHAGLQLQWDGTPSKLPLGKEMWEELKNGHFWLEVPKLAFSSLRRFFPSYSQSSV